VWSFVVLLVVWWTCDLPSLATRRRGDGKASQTFPDTYEYEYSISRLTRAIPWRRIRVNQRPFTDISSTVGAGRGKSAVAQQYRWLTRDTRPSPPVFRHASHPSCIQTRPPLLYSTTRPSPPVFRHASPPSCIQPRVPPLLYSYTRPPLLYSDTRPSPPVFIHAPLPSCIQGVAKRRIPIAERERPPPTPPQVYI